VVSQVPKAGPGAPSFCGGAGILGVGTPGFCGGAGFWELGHLPIQGVSDRQITSHKVVTLVLCPKGKRSSISCASFCDVERIDPWRRIGKGLILLIIRGLQGSKCLANELLEKNASEVDRIERLSWQAGYRKSLHLRRGLR
jgi:hypothetical protein